MDFYVCLTLVPLCGIKGAVTYFQPPSDTQDSLLWRSLAQPILSCKDNMI